MRVSFDLDEVLFVSPDLYETEPPLRFPLNRIYKERLRKGTVELVHRLQDEGFEVWIYTSSFRADIYIRSLFRYYGIRLDGIINARRHLAEVQRDRKEPLPQKMPQFYHIALHIDDEDVIHENGQIYGFHTLKVYEPDDHWVQKVIDEARRIRELEG